MHPWFPGGRRCALRRERVGLAVRAPTAALWIRLMRGWVFFWEGVIKFAFVTQGVGRFTKLGMPLPEVLAPAIAVLETVGGLCFILGVWPRPFALLFIGEMLV